MKIGVGIVTCNRPEMLQKLLESLNPKWYDELVIVNDGTTFESHTDIYINFPDFFNQKNKCLIQNEENLGVGKSKNRAMQYLLDKDCDYIFIVEDDMLFKGNVFEKYIDAHKKTGIHHFMFGYHGPANKGGVSKGQPQPRKIIDYGNISIALNLHCVGAVCFYTKECLEAVGLYDEQFLNAFEHVEHSYRLALAGYSTPYWWWADLADSYNYIEEQACSEESSSIRPREDWQKNIQESWQKFINKYEFGPTSVPDTSIKDVTNILQSMYHAGRIEQS